MNEMLSDEGRVGGALKARLRGCDHASCKIRRKTAALCPKKRTLGVVS